MNSPEKVPIEELIPHRGTIIMIDALLEAAPERGVAAKKFRPGDYGVRGHQVCETALIECLAQTTAALFGYGKRGGSGEEGIGLLVGLSSFSFARLARLDELLLIEVYPGKSFEKIIMVKGKVFAGEIGGECVARGEFKIYLKDEKG
jgi:predicted hotdog family 3-hydroxylacyl-ACP dehydratase